MTKLRQIAQFSLQNFIDDYAVEQYVTALGKSHCVVYTCQLNEYDNDEGLMGYQVFDFEGRPVSDLHPDIPVGDWAFPTTSYDRQHQWGVLKKAPGWGSQTRVYDWARPLDMAEKIALVEAHLIQVMPFAIIGLAYSQPLFEVMLDERWILREVGVAYTKYTLEYDYLIHPIRLFHPAPNETLQPAVLGGVKLHYPTAPIRYGNKLIVTDLTVPPLVTMWRVNDDA